MHETDPNQLKYWVALSRTRLLGAVRYRRLEKHLGPAENIWRAELVEIMAAGIEDRVARKLVAARDLVSPDDEMARLERAGVMALNWHDPRYPARLKEISDPPPVLYVKGQLQPSDEMAVAMVGTRNPTAYGREAAANLAAELAGTGLTIVSGLALGIDGIAHRAALDLGRRTIAVVANGLDIVYPKEHTSLSRRIAESGALLSEVPLGIRPDSRSFPRRNRLISGVSLGTLVVEAGETSGARWTVYHALDQDREVFCVPGTIFSPASRLTNRLIKEGAKLVGTANDVLEELNLGAVTRQTEMQLGQSPEPSPAPPTAIEPASDSPVPTPSASASGEAALPEEARVLGQLDHEPLHIDDIRRKAGLPISEVSSLLTMLELKGAVRQVGCMHYIRVLQPSPSFAA